MYRHLVNILVLDDEPFMLKLLTRMLANLGFTAISTCENGHVALDMLSSDKESPNLILLDINMPKMDGLEFVRRLVDWRYNGSIILISGEDERMLQSAEKLAKAHQIKILGHLHKPAMQEELEVLVRKWMPAQQSQSGKRKKIYSADELRAAITNLELVNYYQPKVSTTTGLVKGVEVLVRWLHPQDGLVFPDQFIQVAETHGLINKLTEVVLADALSQVRTWQGLGQIVHVAVNLSMDSLASLEFLETIIDMVEKSGVPPQMLEFEVTETRLMEDLRIPLEVLSRLRLKRIRLSIDDFGIGNSTLAQLRDLPFDELKIDQSFVHGAFCNDKLCAMFDSSLVLAKQLGMSVVAEGVEDREDWDFVQKSGCDLAQGYFIAKPMPAAEIPSWILAWQNVFRVTPRRS